MTAEYEMPLLAHAMHGAVELHGAHHADFGRSLDRDSSAGARASRSREGCEPAGEPGDRPQSSARRRLRASPRTGHGVRRRADREAGRRVRSKSCGRGKKTSATTIYRPAYHNILSARLQGDRIVGWKHKISGSAVLARFLPPGFSEGRRSRRRRLRADIPYDIPNYRVEFNREEPPGVNTGVLARRGSEQQRVRDRVVHRRAGAQGAGKDPIAFRRAHLDKTPRLQAALDLVRQKSGWGTPLPARCGRGVSAQTSFGSFIATVVECEVDDAGEIKLRRVTTAVDTGLAGQSRTRSSRNCRAATFSA